MWFLGGWGGGGGGGGVPPECRRTGILIPAESYKSFGKTSRLYRARCLASWGHRTGWPGVSILRLGEVGGSLICSFSLCL